MKKILFLCFSIIIIMASCDGRKTKSDALKESIVKFKDSIKPIDIVEYFPKEYTEVQTDTILSNGFRVKIKTFTAMDQSVLKSFTEDSINYKHYFREVVSEITVFKDDKQIFKNTINNKFLKQNLPNIKSLDEYINNQINIDELLSVQTNKLILKSSLCMPKSHYCIDYKVIIDEKGDYTLKKLNHART